MGMRRQRVLVLAWVVGMVLLLLFGLSLFSRLDTPPHPSLFHVESSELHISPRLKHGLCDGRSVSLCDLK